MSRSYVINPLEHSNLPLPLFSLLYVTLSQFWHVNFIWFTPLLSLCFNGTNQQSFGVLSSPQDKILSSEFPPRTISMTGYVLKRITSVLRQPRGEAITGCAGKAGQTSSDNGRGTLLLAKKPGQNLGVGQSQFHKDLLTCPHSSLWDPVLHDRFPTCNNFQTLFSGVLEFVRGKGVAGLWVLVPSHPEMLGFYLLQKWVSM